MALIHKSDGTILGLKLRNEIVILFTSRKPREKSLITFIFIIYVQENSVNLLMNLLRGILED